MDMPALSDRRYEGVHCHLAIERPAATIVVVRLEGWDAGEWGDLPMRELGQDLARPESLELFIDARAVRGATTEVSAEWARWLAEHRDRFRHVSMLTGSPFVRLTANFVRRFAELGEVMRIDTDEVGFDAALARSVAAAATAGPASPVTSLTASDR